MNKCDFSEINEHYKKVSEERKNRSKEEKKAEKEKNEQIIEDLGFCVIDGHREKIGNFRYSGSFNYLIITQLNALLCTGAVVNLTVKSRIYSASQ